MNYNKYVEDIGLFYCKKPIMEIFVGKNSYLYLRSYFIFIFVFLVFLIFYFSSQNIYGFDLYFGVGLVGSTTFPLNPVSYYDMYMKIYDGETFFIGSTFKLKNENFFGLEINYISRGIYYFGEYYFLLFNGLIKLYYSKNCIDSRVFKLNINMGLWLSGLFYSIFKSRDSSTILEIVDINNLSFINFGAFLSYFINFGKYGFDISTNIGFLDDNPKDENYLISTWFSVSFIFFL